MLSSPAATPPQEKQPPSLTEEFKRHMANRENSKENSGGISYDSGQSASDPAYAPHADAPHAVRNVMSVFNGTIVEESRE
jgi:hypothetical protein